MTQVRIFDTTLRDGEQAPGFSMSPDGKLKMARALAALRVDVIEAGFAAASPGDFESIQQIARMIARWQQQLRVDSELKLRLLVIEKPPLHSEQQIASARRRALAVLVHDLNGKLQLELHVGQSVVEIEQRRIHLRHAARALED